MYEECGYYDPIHGSVDDSSSQPPTTYHNPNCNMNTTDHQLEDMNTCRAGSTFSLEDLSHPNMNPPLDDGIDHIQNQLGFGITMESGNWDPTVIQQNMQCYDAGSGLYANPPFPPPPDLLNLLHLPRCSVAPPSVFPSASSISFRTAPGYNPMEMFGEEEGGATIYDPSLQLGYPPTAAQQQQQEGYGLRDLFGSLPQNYGLFCGGMEEREGGGMMDGMEQCRREAGVGLGKGGGGGGGGGGEVKEGIYVTERQRREQLKLKYTALRSLIPNPTKGDRASIVADAIEYIKELRRTLEELNLLVEKKKRDGRMMKAEDDESVAANTDSLPIRSVKDELDHSHNGVLRSSWLQRKSKDSFVDVRIIDHEVNIKLTQKRKASCLPYIAKALDELQLDLVHVTGGNMVDHYIFMLNAKICEGSSVYAGAIAKKLLDVMERQYQALELHDSF